MLLLISIIAYIFCLTCDENSIGYHIQNCFLIWGLGIFLGYMEMSIHYTSHEMEKEYQRKREEGSKV